MEKWLSVETENLIRSWQKYDQKTLLNYLVKDVENPRINIQSILTRHFLLEHVFPERYEYLMEQEIRFALSVNWLLQLLKKPIRSEQLRSILYALAEGEFATEEIVIPKFLQETFSGLTFPNYLCELFGYTPVETTEIPIPEYILNTFQKIWQEVLEQERGDTVSVLEPACGSANDYRYMNTYGMDPFLDYTGFDLCEKNIQNAKHMFPNKDFRLGNVLAMDFPDQAFDFCIIHDLFEHLSIEAMEIAIAEICRVTRNAVSIGFFNMKDIDSHQIEPVDLYHWNTLSVTETKKLFEPYSIQIKVIPIHTFLRSSFHFDSTHNQNAYTMYVTL